MKRKYLMKLGIMLICGSLTASVPVFAKEQPEEKWQYTQKQQNGNTLYTFEELQLSIPEDWEGKIVTGVEKGSITFYHKDSLEAGKKDGETGCGALFTIYCSADYDFAENLPNYYLVGSGEKGIYYITVPGDLHGYQKDETILNQWKEMSEEVEEICKNVKTKNPGAPAYTVTEVNFREKDSMSGKILDVIPSDTEIWITGNLEQDWVKANFDNEDGYVSADYLELPDLSDEEEDNGNSGSSYEKEDTGDSDADAQNTSEKEEDAGDEDSSDGNGEDKTEIPFQGFNQCAVYDENGNERIIRAAEDKNWYDESGVYYGTFEDVDNAIERGSITNENGETYYFSPANIPGSNIKVIDDGYGRSIEISRGDDGLWYDAEGNCYGADGAAMVQEDQAEESGGSLDGSGEETQDDSGSNDSSSENSVE